MNALPVQYANTSDGLSIAYASMGDGPPLLFAATASSVLTDYAIVGGSPQRLIEGLARLGWRITLYDRRGQGLSSRGVYDQGLETRVLDLNAVRSKLGAGRFALVGMSQGTAGAIAYAASNAEQISRLILLEPWLSYRRLLRSSPAARLYNSLQDYWQLGGADDWNEYLLALGSILGNFTDSRLAGERAEGLRTALTPEEARSFLAASNLIDLTQVLPNLAVPSLVIHSDEFPFASQESCQEVAASIPNARFVNLAGCGVETILTVVEGFLREDQPTEATRSGTATHLSKRELEVLRLIAAGKTNRQIADELVISRNTVQNHVASILSKAGLANRAEAAAYAERRGLV